jgi:hypothetical protein
MTVYLGSKPVAEIAVNGLKEAILRTVFKQREYHRIGLMEG